MTTLQEQDQRVAKEYAVKKYGELTYHEFVIDDFLAGLDYERKRQSERVDGLVAELKFMSKYGLWPRLDRALKQFESEGITK
jgi:hypothetical protein